MNVGDMVEDFTLDDQNGQPVKFSDLTSAGPVVVYFFIKAMTTG